MRHSFRSASEVLQLVDQIFIEDGGSMRMFDPEKFPPAGDKMRHISIRQDKGYVEFWPIAPYIKNESDEEATYLRPVDEVRQQHPQEVLARILALEIKKWLTMGRSVFDRKTGCLLYTSPSPRDQRGSRMPSSA